MLRAFQFGFLTPRLCFLGLLIVAQFLTVTGLPLPTVFVKRSAKEVDSREYPCKYRSCGCVSYEACWAGDCCCFSLDEKLRWAAEQGISPPESAKSSKTTASVVKPKRSCCSEKPKKSCCSDKPKSSCCSEKPKPAEDCPLCAKKKSAGQPSPFLIGVHVRKCRGDGPLGWFGTLLQVPPSIESMELDRPQTVPFAPPHDCTGDTLSHTPPSPPPRLG